jgi:hypothetical protein
VDGDAGSPASFELWIDTSPPQILAYGPSSGTLMNTVPSITAALSDPNSGVDPFAISVLINGSSASVSFNQITGQLTTTGGLWKEGSNHLELRVQDNLGNAQVPILWSLMLDTKPPAGSIIINGGAAMTTSVYVTLHLNASDGTSGVAGVLISNHSVTGYVQESYVALRELWKLTPIKGLQGVYVKFIDGAGNISDPISDTIELSLLSPETVITSGPVGFIPDSIASFTYMCPEGGCMFSFTFDNDEWSDWSSSAKVSSSGLSPGNHYFRVKAAKDVNGVPGIQEDEEDPSPAERTWIIGVDPAFFIIPKGPAIKIWRLE